MSTLLWIVMAVALVWVVWKLSRSVGSSDRDGDSGTTFFAADGGSTGTGTGTGTGSEADCGDSSSDGGSCDGGSGGDGGGGD